MQFKPFDANIFSGNPFNMLDKDWMLVTAGTPDAFNTLTASWGAFGIMWGQRVIFAVIRPSRHTYGFMEAQDYFTCSFFTEDYRKALNLLGTKSGRDGDKVSEAGLTPVAIPDTPAVTFAEARETYVCRKLFAQDFSEDAFVDKSIPKSAYPGGDLHRMYVGKIVSVGEK